MKKFVGRFGILVKLWYNIYHPVLIDVETDVFIHLLDKFADSRAKLMNPLVF